MPVFKLFRRLFFAALVSGCGLNSMPEKMDALSNSTDKMASDTSQLSGKTSDVLEESKRLAKLTAMLLKASRQGVSQEQRVRAQQEFTRPDTSFEVATKNAAVYLRSFEFQLWENTWYDTPSGREALFATAIEEFMIVFRGLAARRLPLDPLEVQDNANHRALFALAGTLEQINDLQVESSFQNKFQAVSMLDLILSALFQQEKLDQSLNIGPKFAEKLLQYQDEAFYLLQLRYSIYLAVLADKLLELNQLSWLGKARLNFNAYFGTLPVDLSQMNAMELKEMTFKYAYGALFIRNKMEKLGQTLEIPDTLRSLLEAIRISEDPSAASGKRSISKNLLRAFAQILCENPSCRTISPAEIESVVSNIELRAEAPFSPEYASQADSYLKLQVQKQVNEALGSELDGKENKDYKDLLK